MASRRRALVADLIVCGSGAAGICTAYHAVKLNPRVSVVLIDPRPPLTLTSAYSTEAFRAAWPSEPMRRFMHRSVELLDMAATEHGVTLHRNGYLYAASRAESVADVTEYASKRVTGGRDTSEAFASHAALAARFPNLGLSPEAQHGVFVGQAGWFSTSTLFTKMLESLVASNNVTVVRSAAVSATYSLRPTIYPRLQEVQCRDGTKVSAFAVVNATGPMLQATYERLMPTHLKRINKKSLQLPLRCELHAKAIFHDTKGAVPRDAPMCIWHEPQTLDWPPETRDAIAAAAAEEPKDSAMRRLLEPMPGGVHCRPEGKGDAVIALWECWHRHGVVPQRADGGTEDPQNSPLDQARLPLDRDRYPEVVLRGLSKMFPKVHDAYLRDGATLPKFAGVDGGIYVKTPDNAPLIGRVNGSPRDLVLCGGLAGYGVMGAHAAGELAATIAMQMNPVDDCVKLGVDPSRGFPTDAAAADSGQL